MTYLFDGKFNFPHSCLILLVQTNFCRKIYIKKIKICRQGMTPTHGKQELLAHISTLKHWMTFPEAKSSDDRCCFPRLPLGLCTD